MATEERLISADAFIEDIKTEAVNLFLDGFKGTPQPTDHLFAIIDRINEQPTVDAVEVVHGRWIDTDYKPDIYCKCSVCGRRVYAYDDYNYCPRCGAKMDGGNEDG